MPLTKILGLRDYKIKQIKVQGSCVLEISYEGPVQCPHCGGKDLKSRFQCHNAGKVQSTKSYRPLELIHYEAYKSKMDAKRRELYLKSNRGKTTLKTMLKEYFSSIT